MLSIILLSYYSNNKILNCYKNLSVVLNENNIPFEFIVIDDGSLDTSFEIAKQLENDNSNVFAYQLSKNYSSHYAIFAGLSICKGDCAIPIPDDEQQPFDTIVEMYKIWKEGVKIIIPYRIKRNDGFLSDLFSKLYYKIINYTTEIKFPHSGSDTFFIDREIIDIINERISPINTSSIIEVLRLGFSPYFYPYSRPKGINEKSRWTFKKKMRLFKDTFFSSSTWIIKVISIVGLFFSLMSLFFIILYVYIYFWGNPHFWGQKLPGWTSTVVIISFFSGMILLALSVIAEYIWRIYEEVKARPGYIIKK